MALKTDSPIPGRGSYSNVRVFYGNASAALRTFVARMPAHRHCIPLGVIGFTMVLCRLVDLDAASIAAGNSATRKSFQLSGVQMLVAQIQTGRVIPAGKQLALDIIDRLSDTEHWLHWTLGSWQIIGRNYFRATLNQSTRQSILTHEFK